MSQGIHDDKEHQQRGQCFQRAYEEVAQDADAGEAGDRQSQDRTQDQTGHDPLDQADLIPRIPKFYQIDLPFFSSFS